MIIQKKQLRLKIEEWVYATFEVYTKEIKVKGNKKTVRAFIRRAGK